MKEPNNWIKNTTEENIPKTTQESANHRGTAPEKSDVRGLVWQHGDSRRPDLPTELRLNIWDIQYSQYTGIWLQKVNVINSTM